MTDEIRFTREDVTGVGDAAAAGTGAEASGVEPPSPPLDPERESPAEADRRAAAADGGRPELAVLGAFVGAFVAAKLLGRIGGGSDD